MATKQLSTRANIVGRSVNTHGGSSAIEQSSYKVHAEVSSKRGIAYYRAKKKHSIELMQYEVKRKAIKDAIEGTNKNITPGKWREELKKIDDSIGDIDKEFNKVCEELARVEVLEHNKKELKLFLENESHKIKNIERSREVR